MKERVYICARGRKWYDENKMEARRNDGNPVDGHKHKPTTHWPGGKGKTYYLVNLDGEVGMGGGCEREERQSWIKVN